MDRGVPGFGRMGSIVRIVARLETKSDVENEQKLEEGIVTTA